MNTGHKEEAPSGKYELQHQALTNVEYPRRRAK